MAILVGSPDWNNGAVFDGAVTGEMGRLGQRNSDLNSLVGSTAGDKVGAGYDTDVYSNLANGNYLIISHN
jgi:hypothetical protein